MRQVTCFSRWREGPNSKVSSNLVTSQHKEQGALNFTTSYLDRRLSYPLEYDELE